MRKEKRRMGQVQIPTSDTVLEVDKSWEDRVGSQEIQPRFLLMGCVISGSRLKWSNEVSASGHDTR